MDKIDIAFFIVLGVALLRGFFKGFIYELVSLISVIIALLGALFLSHLLTPVFTSIGLSDSTASFTAGVVLFLAIIFAINILCKILFGSKKVQALGLFDNLIGAAISCAKYSVMLCVLLLLITKLNSNYHLFSESHVEGSTLYNSFLDFAQNIYKLIK
ncbi:MAG: CvpA family protein [Marinifilaceae bacterium]|nr:CvpA family protein [Marinifilaceae bacterium]